MAIKEFVKTLPLALGLLASPLWAAVSPEQASALGDSLTPMGAERAGNASGEIPAIYHPPFSQRAAALAGGHPQQRHRCDPDHRR